MSTCTMEAISKANIAARYRLYAESCRSNAANGHWNQGAQVTLIRMAEDYERLARISEEVSAHTIAAPMPAGSTTELDFRRSAAALADLEFNADHPPRLIVINQSPPRWWRQMSVRFTSWILSLVSGMT